MESAEPIFITVNLDPMHSNQKDGIENIHTMLRMNRPKGAIFTNLTQ